jgi:uncharacterized protein (TIGR01777 family)
MKIVLTGATGFIGQVLTRRLYTAGHDLTVLTRDPERARQALPYPIAFQAWDALHELPPAAALRGCEAIIGLAGENLAGRRWRLGQKRLLRDSRVVPTSYLKEAIRHDDAVNPSLFISASAIGYYGDRGEEVLHETAPPGEGFLAGLTREWEEALFLREVAGTRRLALRIGMVVGAGGGALAKLLPVFRKGLGGPVGSGRQWVSWIHVEDLASLVLFLLEHPALEGVFNAVAPHPVRNREFAKSLGAVLRRPALFPVPAAVLRVVLGEMATVVLDSQRVEPAAALQAGFRFRYETMREALEQAWAETRGRAE